jgi:prolyl-tRNA editing enzyme YbaK/EbsC (Cys-tRNA(Pro) deacylase)
MPINKKITKLLEDNKIKYETLAHRKVYTAFDASQTLRVHPREIAKSLIMKIKKDFYMIILGADKNLDFSKIAKKFKVAQKDIKIPPEKILINKFKIKPGSAHVFASLYKIPVLIDKSFTTLKTGIFSSGSFRESFKIKLKDYLKIEKCEIFSFGKTKKLKIQKPKPKKKQKKSKGKKFAPKKKVIKKKKTKK